VGDEDGDIADDLNLLVVAVLAQTRPLVEEEELFELDALDLRGEPQARARERLVVAAD
jgi:hypothetical protein